MPRCGVNLDEKDITVLTGESPARRAKSNN
jgi:hypothetical protein